MQDENSIQLIFKLEQKLNALIREHKQYKLQLKKLNQKLEQANTQNQQLQEQIDALTLENKSILLRQLSEDFTAHDNLKKYLDEVIEMLDKNIDLL